jgi:hypothetical protein
VFADTIDISNNDVMAFPADLFEGSRVRFINISDNRAVELPPALFAKVRYAI